MALRMGWVVLDTPDPRVDIDQGEVGHVVLADPEGNEFCTLQARAGS